ncbi:hypothetical protein HPB51_025428 [Rhipicephalus microplus]|uniref:Rho-GAP domain-containing protein n=1 Tax=Rhipicephalus microplus TaxID=6941 RepID=A0A9J6DDR4_RHIMP|nr:hypothetical protein HPB51_025428 [Rhipicephalus microplus]
MRDDDCLLVTKDVTTPVPQGVQLWRLTGDQARLQMAGPGCKDGRCTCGSAGQAESAEPTAFVHGPIVLMACQPGIAGTYSEALSYDPTTPVVDHSGNRGERNLSDGGEPMSGQEADSVESVRLPSSTTNAGGDDDGLTVHGPQVPRVVNCCLNYLEKHGLNTVGIFRVNGSKRRVRQLRDEFDSGREVHLDLERPHPHDVAQLLKEFLRELPQPLLTCDLYQPFLYTQRVQEKAKQLDILQQLVRLLPTHSRDTLWALLKFLNSVAENSVDKKSSTGQTLPGNKMDTHNLATMLGPNILRLSNTSEKDKFIVENNERAEEHGEVILVVRQLIDNYQDLFKVSAEDLDRLYRRLLVDSPEDLEILLRRRFHCAPGVPRAVQRSEEDDVGNQVNAEDDEQENSTGKEEKAFKKSKMLAFSVLSCFGGSSEKRHDSGDASCRPPTSSY